MGILSRIFGRQRTDVRDAERVYAALLRQSRNVQFYGEGHVPDTYDGRVDCLTFHMSAVMYRLSELGENGERLSQSIFDVMVDDFDIALREEGLTDTGVSKRIKPIIGHFYARLKDYTESLNDEQATTRLMKTLRSGAMSGCNPEFAEAMSLYLIDFYSSLNRLSLGEIAQAKFEFPSLNQY